MKCVDCDTRLVHKYTRQLVYDKHHEFRVNRKWECPNCGREYSTVEIELDGKDAKFSIELRKLIRRIYGNY